MKINIKVSDLTTGKEQLESNLNMLLKKPMLYLSKNPQTWLPFIYEVNFFGLNRGLLSIGQTKEGEKFFSRERVKGKGRDEKGNITKIDKKNVAYGRVRINQEGVYEFLVDGGVMKQAQAKKVIKSIGILKKTIGGNFTILDSVPVEVENEQVLQEENEQKKSIIHHPQYKKIKENLFKLQNAVGIVDAEKVQASIEKYEKALLKLANEAKGDNDFTQDELRQISEVEQALVDMKTQLYSLNGRKIKLTPKNRAKVATHMEAIKKRIQQISQSVEMYFPN